jgi:hypothetical protein
MAKVKSDSTTVTQEARMRISELINQKRKQEDAQKAAERAKANFDSTKLKNMQRGYQLRDSSMPLAPTQFNDM